MDFPHINWKIPLGKPTKPEACQNDVMFPLAHAAHHVDDVTNRYMELE